MLNRPFSSARDVHSDLIFDHKRKPPPTAWRTDCWDAPLVSGLLASTSVHLVIVTIAGALGITHGNNVRPAARHVAQHNLGPEVVFLLDSDDMQHLDTPNHPMRSSLHFSMRPSRTDGGLHSTAAKERHEDWPDLEVPIPERGTAGQHHKHRQGGPGEQRTPNNASQGVDPPGTDSGGCRPEECGGTAWAETRGKRCWTAQLRAETAAGFEGLHTFWNARSHQQHVAPGRMILRWRITEDGSVPMVEILRDDVQDAVVRRWAVQRVRSLRYDPVGSAGCRVTWHLGFGINLVGLDESLGEMADRLVADEILDAGEGQEVRDMLYDDRVISITEMEFLYQLSIQVEPAQTDPSWDSFLMQAMDDYLQGIGASPPAAPTEHTAPPVERQFPS